jgi:hypothetical protein
VVNEGDGGRDERQDGRRDLAPHRRLPCVQVFEPRDVWGGPRLCHRGGGCG